MRVAGLVISFLLIVFVGFPVSLLVAGLTPMSAPFYLCYAALGIWLVAATANAGRAVRIAGIILYLSPVIILFVLGPAYFYVVNIPKNVALAELAANSSGDLKPAVESVRGENIRIRGDKTECDKLCVQLLIEAGAASVSMEKTVLSQHDRSHNHADSLPIGTALTYKVLNRSCRATGLGLYREEARLLGELLKLAGRCIWLSDNRGAKNADWVFSIGAAAQGAEEFRGGLVPSMRMERLENSKYRRVAYQLARYVWIDDEEKYFGADARYSYQLIGMLIGTPIDDKIRVSGLFGSDEETERLEFFRRLAESGDIYIWRAFLYEVAALPELSADVFGLIWKNYSRYGDSGLGGLSGLMASRTEDFKPALPFVIEMIMKEEPGWHHLYGGLKWYDLADLAPFESQLREIEDRKTVRYHRSKEHRATTLCRKGRRANDVERKDLLETLDSVRVWSSSGLSEQLLAVARLESPGIALEISHRVDNKNKLWNTRRCLEKLDEHYGDREIPARLCHIEGCSRVWDLGRPPASLSR